MRTPLKAACAHDGLVIYWSLSVLVVVRCYVIEMDDTIQCTERQGLCDPEYSQCNVLCHCETSCHKDHYLFLLYVNDELYPASWYISASSFDCDCIRLPNMVTLVPQSEMKRSCKTIFTRNIVKCY